MSVAEESERTGRTGNNNNIGVVRMGTTGRKLPYRNRRCNISNVKSCIYQRWISKRKWRNIETKWISEDEMKKIIPAEKKKRVAW